MVGFRVWIGAGALGALALGGAPIAAAPPRETLAVHGDWAAFREGAPTRCFAIAEPRVQPRRAGRPFADVVPAAGPHGVPRLHLRLRQPRPAGSPVRLLVNGRAFALAAGPTDAWPADARADAAIVRLMRGDGWMRIESTGPTGRRVRDVYLLRGAATAIDAATIGCAR